MHDCAESSKVMNPPTDAAPTTNASDPVRRHLAALAEPPLPEGLLHRLHIARRRRSQRLAVAGVAILACALALPLLLSPATPPAAMEPANLALSGGASDWIQDIRSIDQALQNAYLRDASEDETAPLWQAREALLSRIQPEPANASQI